MPLADGLRAAHPPSIRGRLTQSLLWTAIAFGLLTTLVVWRVMAHAAIRPSNRANAVAPASTVLACWVPWSRTSVCELLICLLVSISTAPCSVMRCSACSAAVWALR